MGAQGQFDEEEKEEKNATRTYHLGESVKEAKGGEFEVMTKTRVSELLTSNVINALADEISSWIWMMTLRR